MMGYWVDIGWILRGSTIIGCTQPQNTLSYYCNKNLIKHADKSRDRGSDPSLNSRYNQQQKKNWKDKFVINTSFHGS
jgi:hypothetical protein